MNPEDLKLREELDHFRGELKLARIQCDEIKTQYEAMDDLGLEVKRLRARVAELESARGEPVAWMLKTGHGTKLAESKPECELDLWKPLYTAPPAPVVDVDKISEVRLRAGAHAIYKLTEFAPTPDEMRAALRAIFNKGE